MRFELLSAQPHTVRAQKYYIVVIPCALMVCQMYIPLTLWPVALRLRVYISGKPLMPMVYLLNDIVIYKRLIQVNHVIYLYIEHIDICHHIIYIMIVCLTFTMRG